MNKSLKKFLKGAALVGAGYTIGFVSAAAKTVTEPVMVDNDPIYNEEDDTVTWTEKVDVGEVKATWRFTVNNTELTPEETIKQWKRAGLLERWHFIKAAKVLKE